jgi:uncharacterized protein
MKSAEDKIQILKELQLLLKKEYPTDVDEVILFGSQATNQAREYSDYDILVILKDAYDWRLENAIMDSCYEIDLKYDILTDVQFISRPELKTIKGKQPFIQNALEQGLTV